jgi:hypothetical protein
MSTIDLTTLDTPDVPNWLQGAWSRVLMRTTATGVEDRTRDCIYLQTEVLYADIRVPADRPSLTGRRGVDDCTPQELAAVASVNGFAGWATFTAGICHWNRPIDFQAPTGRKDQGCMGIQDGHLWEYGLQGQHVEQYAPRASGARRKGAWALAPDPVDPRPGVLVIVDDLVIRAVARPGELPLGKALGDLVVEAANDRAALRNLFDSELSLAVLNDLAVTRSTLPWREGLRLAPKGAFRIGAGPDELIEQGERRQYRWRRRGAEQDAAATAQLLNG